VAASLDTALQRGTVGRDILAWRGRSQLLGVWLAERGEELAEPPDKSTMLSVR